MTISHSMRYSPV